MVRNRIEYNVRTGDDRISIIILVDSLLIKIDLIKWFLDNDIELLINIVSK